ncbi:hypothetical protein [Halococcus salifodinae]|uniref:Uncharacterized protein n=1 Tax=Halococcus salifodinae DSM 8989 TaxID=1227456 RepID=M0MQ71_9EURY|nr:hypothetical protein [Halococcus salifodinae]EMA47781.1 hypothetical protein C450_20721 [Halococcus salifodinae DSM 8989]
MSTDPILDTDTDAEPAFEPCDGERVSDTTSSVAAVTESDGFEADNRLRELTPLVPYLEEKLASTRREAVQQGYSTAPL